MIPFGPYLPDQPAFRGGSQKALNVLPRAIMPDGGTTYGPLASLASVSDALTNRPQGAGAFRASAGNVHTFCGDSSNLFKLNGTAWSEVSSSTGAYTVATDDAVNFIQYGERVISVNGHTDQPQSYVLGTSTKFADLAAAAPRARRAAVIKDFVFLANTWDSTDGSVGNRVWWSAIDDPTDWPTIGSADAAQKQSDRQDLPVGGWVQAITGAIGGMDGAIFCEKAIYRVQYEGPPTAFGFYEVERDRGTPAPNSVVNVGSFGFYLGEDGFYSFSGSGSRPIGGQKIDKHFFEELDQNYFHRVYGVADPINKLVIWAYPGPGHSNGQPNAMVVYNWEIDRWADVEQAHELLFRDLTAGYTLEDLDAIGDLDSLPFSLDSRVWTGGRLVLSAFDASNKLARFAGSNMAATIGTPEVTAGELFNKPHNMTFVEGVRPHVDGGTVTVSLKHRSTPGGSLTTTGPSSLEADGIAHFDISDRYIRAEVNIAAGGSWSHAEGIDYEAMDDGDV